ncbi:MAG TPA: diguanylate cyclase [Chloroflexota bacterium]|nr:diguanylate cyclase [Chloroflexota bacterium]
MLSVSVLLAMTSSLQRARIRLALNGTAGIQLLGEATNGAQAAHQAREGRPRFLVCDSRMLEEPEIGALFALGENKAPFKVVVVAPNGVMPPYSGQVPVAAVVSVEISGVALLARLQEIIGLSEGRQAPPPMVGMRDRFMVADEGMQGTHGWQSHTTTRLSDPTGQMVRSLVTPPNLLTQQLERARVPRRDEAVQAEVFTQLSRVAQHKDSATGLPGLGDLSDTLRALPTANYPVAVLVVDIAFPPTQYLNEGETQATLHSATGVLRSNVRHHDLVFHLEKMSFAIVMPGMEPAISARSLQRLRKALDRFRQPTARRPLELRVAMGIGFWEPGVPPTHPLQEGWQSMLADRHPDSPSRG